MPTECQAIHLGIIDRTENKTNDCVDRAVFKKITFSQITCFPLLACTALSPSYPCLEYHSYPLRFISEASSSMRMSRSFLTNGHLSHKPFPQNPFILKSATM